jgi:hypothetical protein
MPDFEFINQSKIGNEDKFNFHSKMRKAAQDFGYSHQAQENFYLESKYRMLFNADPNNIPGYRNMNSPSLSDTFKIAKTNAWRIDRTAKLILRKISNEVRGFAKVEFLRAYLSAKVGTLLAWMNYLVWGFGEKPWRVMIVALADIIFFALLYDFFHYKNFAEAFVTSVFVFTSISYGDLTSLVLEYVVAVQVLSGFVLLGLFLSALVNKVRY